MNSDPKVYTLDFTEEHADLKKVIAVLDENTEEGLSYETLEENGVGVVRVRCGYATFFKLAQAFSDAGEIPTKLTAPKLIVSLQLEQPEFQA